MPDEDDDRTIVDALSALGWVEEKEQDEIKPEAGLQEQLDLFKAENEKFRVGFFVGCAVDYLMTDVGKALVELCGKLNVTVIIPKNQTCCGLPAEIYGDIEASKKMLEENTDSFKDKKIDYLKGIIESLKECLKYITPEHTEKIGMTKILISDLEFWLVIAEEDLFPAMLLNELREE